MHKELKNVIEVLSDHKAEDICYLKISDVNPLCDYYIICSATSSRHALALANYAEEQILKDNGKINHIEGNSSSNWVLLDGGDIVIHIFVNEARNHYGLEKMWSNLEIYKVE